MISSWFSRRYSASLRGTTQPQRPPIAGFQDDRSVGIVEDIYGPAISRMRLRNSGLLQAAPELCRAAPGSRNRRRPTSPSPEHPPTRRRSVSVLLSAATAQRRAPVPACPGHGFQGQRSGARAGIQAWQIIARALPCRNFSQQLPRLCRRVGSRSRGAASNFRVLGHADGIHDDEPGLLQQIRSDRLELGLGERPGSSPLHLLEVCPASYIPHENQGHSSAFTSVPMAIISTVRRCGAGTSSGTPRAAHAAFGPCA